GLDVGDPHQQVIELSRLHVERLAAPLPLAQGSQRRLDMPNVLFAWNLQAEIAAKLVELHADIGELELIDQRQPFESCRRYHQADRQQHDETDERSRDACRHMTIAAALDQNPAIE